ncbi:MAG: DNA-3-methyladenine glycosylase [Bacteroidota bacterium]
MKSSPLHFLQGSNPVPIAQALLGVEIITCINGQKTSARITETEAYFAPDDKASHAKNNRRTKRTEIMFGPAGRSYVYLIYGIHELFNIVTGPEGMAHAVLIRAVEPVSGVDMMKERRGSDKHIPSSVLGKKEKATIKPQLTAGPGVLTKALGVTRAHNGVDLLDENSEVYLRVTGSSPDPSQIVARPRIGIDYAGSPWVEKPWRFYLKNTKFVSKL